LVFDEEHGSMRHIFAVAFAALLHVSSAWADNAALKFTNKSGEAIIQLTALPRATVAAGDLAAVEAAGDVSSATSMEVADPEQIAVVSEVAAPQPENILNQTVAHNAQGSAPVEIASASCVQDLTFTFASGKTLTIPNMDICQIDNIVVE
jgi:hypothetical protein